MALRANLQYIVFIIPIDGLEVSSLVEYNNTKGALFMA